MVIFACACTERNESTLDVTAESVLDSPSVTLKEKEGSEFVEIADGLLLDSSVLVADRATAQIHRYSSLGEHEAVLGRKGEGPGEFQSIEWMESIGSSIWVYDRELRRLTEFSADGKYVRTAVLPSIDGFSYTQPIGMLKGGLLVVAGFTVPVRERVAQVIRDSGAIVTFDLTTSEVRQVVTFQSSELYSTPFGRVGTLSGLMPFGRQTGVLASQGRVVTVSNDQPLLTFSDSTSRRTIDIPIDTASLRSIDGTEVSAVRRRFVEGEPALLLGDFFDAMPLPKQFGYFGSTDQRRLPMLARARNGTIWLRLAEPALAINSRWALVDSALQYRGRVAGPPGSRMLDGTATEVLLLEWTAANEPRISIRRILLPSTRR